MPFIRAVMEADFAQVEQYKNELVGYMQDLPLEQGQSLALLYLYNLYYEMGFYDMQVAYKLGLDHRLYQRLRAIETQRDLVIYFTSVLRRIMEYFELLKSQALILLLSSRTPSCGPSVFWTTATCART